MHLVLGAQGGLSLLASGQDGVRVDPSNPHAAVERLCDYARRFSPRAVLATDDSTVELAARVAEVLGLDHNSARASRISRRKDLARQVLADAGLPVPPWRLIRLDKALEPQLVGTSYPAVVKPLAFAGSRGVIRANSPAELERACERVRLLLAECSEPEERLQVLVEGFIPGKEIAIEGLLRDGELEVLAVFDKPDPLDGPYFAETYYVTPSRLAPLDAGACLHAGGTRPAAHTDCAVDRCTRSSGCGTQDAWLLELAARTIGGECARLLRFRSGASLEDIVLANAVGDRLETVARCRGGGGDDDPCRREGLFAAC